MMDMETSEMEVDGVTKLIVKWNAKEYEIEVEEDNHTVGDLKYLVQLQTGVLPERQKLLNLKLQGKLPDDDCKLCELSLKPNSKIMMVGSLEQDIVQVNTTPAEVPEVIDDLMIQEEEVALENMDVHLAKIENRIKKYDVTILNPFRDGKKLLVLDIDYTLFDHISVGQSADELVRPHLHKFLKSVYKYYDIVIWSSTSMKYIRHKMKLFGVEDNENYKIAFYLDSLANITVYTQRLGVTAVKPLGVIWGKFPQFSQKNTIMIDDLRRNFLMNPKNGLKIKAFRAAHVNRSNDDELLKLKRYLKNLAKHCEDFSTVNHSRWKKYDPKKSS